MPPSDDAVDLAELPTRADRISALSAAEIDAFVSATSDAVLVLDAEGRCVRLGPCAADPRNAPLQALLGRRLDEVFPPEVAHAFRVAIGQALSTRKPQRSRTSSRPTVSCTRLPPPSRPRQTAPSCGSHAR